MATHWMRLVSMTPTTKARVCVFVFVFVFVFVCVLSAEVRFRSCHYTHNIHTLANMHIFKQVLFSDRTDPQVERVGSMSLTNSNPTTRPGPEEPILDDVEAHGDESLAAASADAAVLAETGMRGCARVQA